MGQDLDGEPGGERVLWTGRPSIPLSWLARITVRYKLTNERLIITRRGSSARMSRSSNSTA